MSTFLQDSRYGIRMLMKKPGFTLAAVLALALGIGVNSAIFSVVNGVLLRSLPYEEPDRVMTVLSSNRQSVKPEGTASYPDFADWKSGNQVFEQMAVFRSKGYTLTGTGEPERISGARASADFFSVLGVKPVLGRTFLPEEDRPGGERVIVIGHGLWQRNFGADPNIIGRALTLDGNSNTVVGVLPAGLSFPIEIQKAEIWSPLSLDGNLLEQRGVHYLKAIGRLKAGVTVEQAQAEMTAIASRLEQAYPDNNTDRIVTVSSLYEQLVGQIRPALLIMLGAVGFVLAVACSNVANLLLARAAARQKEISVRLALGAGRGRIIRQLLTESLLLSLVGGGAGLLLALWGIDLLISLGPDDIPRLNAINLDGRVLGFTFFISVLTGIGFGLAPALKASRSDLNSSLKEGGRNSTGSLSSNRMRNLLVISEMALALVLLVGAGLLIRSFIRLQQVNPGFDPKNVLTMQVSLPGSRYKTGAQIAGFFGQALERVKTLPGVESAGAVTGLPLTGDGDVVTTFTIENRPAPPEGQEPRAAWSAITPDYFRTLHIPLLKGQEFTEANKKGTPGRIIISDTMARQHFPNEDPIGQQIALGILTDDDDPQLWEIAAVVGDVRDTAINAEPIPHMYVPYSQVSWSSMTLAVRASSDPMNLVDSVRGQVLAIDKDQPVSQIQTMERLVAGSIAQPRFYLLLLAIFAALALLLAAVGIYGVLSYSVTQRMHEIGIRMALGAQGSDVIKLVVGQGMKLALAGIFIGLAGSLLLTRLLSSLVYEVSVTDPLTFAGTAAILVGVALVACCSACSSRDEG